MKSVTRSRFSQFAASCLFVGILTAGCTSSETGPGRSGTSTQASAVTVYVVFDGPWAFVPDPAGSDKVLAIAPKAKDHSDAYLKAREGIMLPTGIYELEAQNRISPIEHSGNPVTANYSITAKAINNALNNKMNRFVIYVPKPDGYGIAEESASKVGSHYPLVATDPEVQYASSIALQYTTTSLAGFRLTGSPDQGAFNSYPIEIGAPKIIQIAMEPTVPDPDLACSVLSKQAFYDVNRLLGLNLFIDFEDYLPGCQADDPQNPNHPNPTRKPLTVTVFENIRSVVQGTPESEDRKKVLEGLEIVQSIILGSREEKVDLGEGIRALQDAETYLRGFETKDSPDDKFKVALKNVNLLMKIFHRPQNDCKAAQLKLTIAP